MHSNLIIIFIFLNIENSKQYQQCWRGMQIPEGIKGSSPPQVNRETTSFVSMMRWQVPLNSDTDTSRVVLQPINYVHVIFKLMCLPFNRIDESTTPSSCYKMNKTPDVEGQYRNSRLFPEAKLQKRHSNWFVWNSGWVCEVRALISWVLLSSNGVLKFLESSEDSLAFLHGRAFFLHTFSAVRLPGTPPPSIFEIQYPWWVFWFIFLEI